MKNRWIRLAALLMALLTLWGCGDMPEPEESTIQESVQVTVETEAPPTVPEDGDPNDVTCKGSYTSRENPDAVVAELDGAQMTNGVLNAWYWAAAAEYREAGHEVAPDFDKPLDTQPCQIDYSVNSWQQYFLRRALNNWHSAQALTLQGEAQGLEPEEAYKPNLKNHEKYLTDIPAMEFHYSYNLETYHPNTMHQEYLDDIPYMLIRLALDLDYGNAKAMAEQAFGTTLADLRTAVEIYNRGYMYFTSLSYDAVPEEEAVESHYGENQDAYSQTETLVDFRHILLVPDDLVQEDDRPSWVKKKEGSLEPVVLERVTVDQEGKVTCSEEAWAAALVQAEQLLKDWQKEWNHGEGSFAALARQHSEDPGSNINGGAYHSIRRGQMLDVIDNWCFDADRQPGDTAIVRSDYGYHILYFSGSTEASYAQAEEDLTVWQQEDLILAAREAYPMEVHYEAICLAEAEAVVPGSELLYPDIAHERYPEVPLYLQQDYLGTMYGSFELRTNGCGITTMSMLASYMTDTELTPPEMCARYGNYSFINGTDGRIFQLESPVLGFYCKEKTYEPSIAKQALEEGYMVVVLQHKGYWTGGGHYLLLEKMNEDGTIQVRDSNIFNYQKLKGHSEDKFSWSLITPQASAYWIFEKKVTAIPACSRCGTPEGVMNSLMPEAYICEKCEPAMLRRSTYLNYSGT